MKTSITLREIQDTDSNGYIELRVFCGQDSRAQDTRLQLELEDVRFLTHLLAGFLRGKGMEIASHPNWPQSR